MNLARMPRGPRVRARSPLGVAVLVLTMACGQGDERPSDSAGVASVRPDSAASAADAAQRIEPDPTPVLLGSDGRPADPRAVPMEVLQAYLDERDFVAGDSAHQTNTPCKQGDTCAGESTIELRPEAGSYRVKSAALGDGWRAVGKILLVKGPSTKRFDLGAGRKTAHWWIGPDTAGKPVAYVIRTSDRQVVAGPIAVCWKRAPAEGPGRRRASRAFIRHVGHENKDCDTSPAGPAGVRPQADPQAPFTLHLACFPCDFDWCSSPLMEDHRHE